jgi:hypothetical protein
MSTQQQLNLAYWSEWLVLLAPAFIVLFVRFRNALIVGPIAVAVAWISVNVMRFNLTLPLIEEVWAVEAPESDGFMAGNVALLFFGWVVPLFAVSIVLLSRYLWRRFNRSITRQTRSHSAQKDRLL